MGKVVDMDVESEEEQVKDVPEKAVVKKQKKGIKKTLTKGHQKQSSTLSKESGKTSSTLSKVARKVNLHQKKLSLEEKQNIFNKVQGELGSKKKIPRREKKKQRYLIKKVFFSLFSEFEETNR